MIPFGKQNEKKTVYSKLSELCRIIWKNKRDQNNCQFSSRALVMRSFIYIWTNETFCMKHASPFFDFQKLLFFSIKYTRIQWITVQICPHHIGFRSDLKEFFFRDANLHNFQFQVRLSVDLINKSETWPFSTWMEWTKAVARHNFQTRYTNVYIQLYRTSELNVKLDIFSVTLLKCRSFGGVSVWMLLLYVFEWIQILQCSTRVKQIQAQP